ncbi:MAG TPA: alginate lyase family protein [Vicinamibacterales bacterium]|nr:alginate lyase family protein [Vicinamibacterales bacterium]
MNKISADTSYVVPAFTSARGSRSVAAKLRRLRRMTLSEIAGRSRQEAAKLIDRVTASDRPIDTASILRDHAPAFVDHAAALHILREAAPLRFFAGVENLRYSADAVREHHDASFNSVAATLQHRFDLLGYRTLWFGDPIDWHLDPVWARRAPRVHWTQLDPLDPDLVGDSKVVWELNRHQWVARLAHASAVSGEERYAESALGAIESWIDANPYGIGVNWSSSLEVAYRLMSWSWTLMLIRESAALSPARLSRILANVWLHANYVSRYLSFYFSPNTHLTGEALGLFYAGNLFREFDDAARWRRIGARVLVAESRTQICGDGVHFERSTCYHRYTVETYQQFLLLAARNGVPVPPALGDQARRMVDFMLAVRKPDGALPEIGDADGGRLLPLVERDQCDPRGAFAVAAAMFGRGDFADAAGGLTPDVSWLMGEEGVRAFAAATPAKPSGPTSRIFPSGGYAVMRTGWERDAHQMIVDVGPLGCSFSAGHGHADLLSVQCAAFGEPVIVDPGTYCYTPETEWRNFFRGTAAHSTVTIDGRDQVEPEGPFGWRTKPRVHVREWRANAECDLVDASHDAYGGITHRRRVLFVKPDYWVVVDDVTADLKVSTTAGVVPGFSPASHRIDLGFQFAPMEVSVVRDRWVRAITPGGNTLWVGTFASATTKASVKTGELAPIQGWVSSDYGQRMPAPHLVFSAKTPLPWRSITLLIPQRGDRSSVPAVSALFDDHNLPIGVELEALRQSVFVDDSDIFRSVDH